jgi:hypothetical protein
MTARPAACQPVAAEARRTHVIGMTEKEKGKDERLAAALRENLKRRKAQARAATKDDPKKTAD